MKLNVASGMHPAKGLDWIDLDMAPSICAETGLDVLADARSMPFADATFDGAYLGHVCEHLEQTEALPALLNEVARVCRNGARVGVVGPCMLRALKQNEPPFILEAIVGDGEGSGAHAWIPTERLTAKLLEASGAFSAVETVDVREMREPDWPNPAPDSTWQCAFVAVV